MGLAEVLTTIVAPLIVALIQSAIKAGQSLGLDVAQLKAAIAVELRSQADQILADVADIEKKLDAEEAPSPVNVAG